MAEAIDEIGNRFGRLVVVAREPNSAKGKARWRCLCDCGKEKVVEGGALRFRSYKSCGCGRAPVTHGLHKSRIYNIWWSMRTRCQTPTSANYRLYGGRGIKICDRWLGERGFVNFLDDMGHPPDAHSLDRVDVNGDYEPTNCRWSDVKTQNDNRRSSLKRVAAQIDLAIERARSEPERSFSSGDVSDLLRRLRYDLCGAT